MIELLDYQETPLGLLCLRRRELLSRPGTIVTEVTLDHVFLMSSYHTDSERALTNLALEMHSGSGLRVMVGGLGLGFTAREALDSERVAEVEVIEFLPPVIEWLAKGWVVDAERLRADPRFSVREDDVFERLARPPEPGAECDLILLDVDHAPDELLAPANAAFYTEEGLARVRRHLAPGGILGVWSAFPSDEFTELLRSEFEDIRVEVVTWWNDLIDQEIKDTLFFARRPRD